MKKTEQIVKILLGNFLLAFSVNMFILPFNFISGGSAGLALILEYFLNIPFEYSVLLINVSMFIAGFYVLGKGFAMTTLLSTVMYPLFIRLTASVNEMFVLTFDPLVAAISAGLLTGAALGLVIQSGASTGGLDIPPLIIEKKTKTPVSVSMAMMDASILLIQMLFSSSQGILCGLILVFVVSFTMNRILTTGTASLQVMVMSERYEELREAFLNDLNRGVTLFEIETGYLRNEQKAVISIISQKHLHEVQKKVNEIDNKAFMIVSRVQQVNGLGFKEWKKYTR